VEQLCIKKERFTKHFKDNYGLYIRERSSYFEYKEKISEIKKKLKKNIIEILLTDKNLIMALIRRGEHELKEASHYSDEESKLRFLQSARGVFLDVLKIEEKNIIAITNIAEIYQQLKKPNLSKKYYNKLLEIDETNVKACVFFCKDYFSSGDRKKAQGFVDRLESTGNKPLVREIFLEEIKKENKILSGLQLKMQNNKFKEAGKGLKKIYEGCFQSVKIGAQYVICLVNLEDYKKADKVLDEIRVIKEENRESFLNELYEELCNLGTNNKIIEDALKIFILAKKIIMKGSSLLLTHFAFN
jgi:tetratricopeptide (TPR) repeat protein